MAVLTRQPKARRRTTTKRAKPKTTAKKSQRKTPSTKHGGVYMLRPRRTPQALKRAKKLGELVRQELAAVEPEGTLDDLMRQLRGLAWSP